MSIKVLFKLPLRQTAGLVASLLKLAGLDWPVPDFSTLCRRQRTLAVQIPFRRADGAPNLLEDSTGIKSRQSRFSRFRQIALHFEKSIEFMYLR